MMLDFQIHWAWVPAIVLVVIGLVVFWLFAKDDGDFGIGGMFGCLLFIICVLLALAFLGIFVW
jgi:uncharacterized Tic20 family protein